MAKNQPQTEATALEFEGELYPATEAADGDSSFYSPNDDEQSLYVRVLKAGKSGNTVTHYEYPASVVQDAVPLFEGAHVYQNHVTDQEWQRMGGIRPVQDKLGVLRQARYSSKFTAAEARLFVFDTATYHKLKRGRDAYGISFFGRVAAPPPNSNPRIVTRIAEVRSVDIVDRPGAGGAISPAYEAEIKEILNMADVPTTPEATPAPQGASLDDVLKALGGLTERIGKLEKPAPAAVPAPPTTEPAPASESALQQKLQQTEAELIQLKRDALVARLANEVNGKVKLQPPVLALAAESFHATVTDEPALRTALEAHFTRYAAIQPAATPTKPQVVGNGEAIASEGAVQRNFVSAATPRVGDDLSDWRSRMGWNAATTPATTTQKENK